MNNVLVTDVGTEVYEPSAKEFATYLEARAQALAGSRSPNSRVRTRLATLTTQILA